MSTQSRPVPFHLVGTGKFVLLCVVTLGLYQMYWFYRQWQRLRDEGGEDVWPVVRAPFAGLFSYWFFLRVDDEADREGVPSLVSPLLMAGIYFAAISCPYLGAPAWVPLVGTVAILAYTQSRINGWPSVRALPVAARNSRLTWLNWAGTGVFACAVAIVLLPDTLPPSAPDAELVQAAHDLQQTVPQRLNSDMTLERVQASDAGLTFRVRLDTPDSIGSAVARRVDEAKRGLVRLACRGGGLPNRAIDNRVPVHFAIVNGSGRPLSKVAVMRRSECFLVE